MSQMQIPAAQPQPAAQPAPAPGQPAPAPGQPGQQPAAIVKPDGIDDAEWAALGDPGKNAIIRERARAQAAEHALAAARARPGPPPGHQPSPAQPQGQPAQPQPNTPQAQPPAQPPQPGQSQPFGQNPNDIAGMIQQAVSAAVSPLIQANLQRDADTAAEAVWTAVHTAAGTRFLDPTDAMYGVDVTAVVDANGRPDPVKITAQLDSLLQRKPHLGKPAADGRPQAIPGGPQGAVQVPQQSIEEATKASLARMRAAAGLPPLPTA